MTTVRTAALALSVGTLGLATLRSVAAPPAKAPPKRATPPVASFAKDVKGMLSAECLPCHGKESPSAGLNLTPLLTEAGARANLGVAEKAMGRVLAGEMPPGRPLPMARRKALQAWTENALADQCRLADPGRVTLRRLNRDEYNRTVADLLGTKLRPADDFPGDDVGNGFDNMGDVLTTSPLLMEKLLDSAERLAREAVLVPKNFTRRYDGSDFAGAGGPNGSKLALNSGGVATKVLRGIVPGNYRLHVAAWAQQAGDEAAKMRVLLDGKPLALFEVPNTKAKDFELPLEVPQGEHRLGVEFTNDYYNEKTKADRNLFVDSVEMTGPLGAVALPASHKRIIPYEPEKGQEEATARKFIAAFAGRAFRRPATPQDLDRLMPVYEAGAKGGSFDEGMRLAVQAVLSSPRFLFRLEQDPVATKGKVRSLDGYEVASRLSYFLWSSMPDATLMDLAAKGKLTQPAVIRAQVRRMIADPKAQALADNFAAQWLNLRKLAIVEFDPKQYPVTDALRDDMATETKMFFLSVLRNGRTISDFVDADYTYLDGRMASHYGIEGVTGDEWRRVPLKGERGGVLTQASVLTVTSNPTRTSPTKRGKWVLENIFGTPPPPPPPGVSDIPSEKPQARRHDPAATDGGAPEEPRLRGLPHRRWTPSASGWRTSTPSAAGARRRASSPWTPPGPCPRATSRSAGPAQLEEASSSRKSRRSPSAIAEKLLTYALGRGVDFKDKCALDEPR